MDKINTKKLKSEQWKYTNSDIFKNFDLNFSPTCKILKQKCNLNEIIIYNGQVTQCGENIKNDKIQIHNIYDALDKNINHFKKIFNTIAPETQDLFLNYNTSNYSGGYYLYIPKNLTPDYVITIKNIVSEGSNEAFSNYRNFIHCDENIKATILNEEIFPINQCINIACEAYVNKNAQLEIINHSEKPKTKQIYNFSACIDEDSKLDYHAIDISGNLSKNSYYINLNKPGSECLFNGFNIANNKEHNDNYIQINHNSPHTISNLNYKIIGDGNAKSILFVKSIIKKDSHHSEAYQKNNNLILSDKSTVHSNPQLEIYNDDVKCSHGSATGQIDDEAIYYMRTRGINEKLAKQLILNSFIDEIIEEISALDIQNKIKLKIKSYLKDGS